VALEHPDLGRRIAQLRAAADTSQRELAAAIGLDQSAVARIETGQRRVDAAEAVAIADYLGVGVDEIIAPRPAAVALRAEAGDDELAEAVSQFRNVIDDFFAFERAAGGVDRLA
jgi:transcriptional regulator with XRE-family HTH domain